MSEFSDDFFRTESVRLVGMLVRRIGVNRLELAEDIAQEALVRALQTWPYRGIPDNPSAWLTQVAKNQVTDFFRRENRWKKKEDDIAEEHGRWSATSFGGEAGENEDTFVDDTLRMMFVCFHPQLSSEAQTALALRTLCGLTPAEIASAFLVSEAAISKRLVRARQRIRDLELSFSVPESEELPNRLEGVLGTLYLLFNEGYKASSGERLVKAELCQKAIYLTTLLVAHPNTATPTTFALLSLMLLNAARLPGRSDDGGNLLRLHEQDRSAWDRDMIERGIHCLVLAGKGEAVTSYHLKAGIAACHSTASDENSTDWSRILSLYDHLISLSDSPLFRLNRAVALSKVSGPQAGLDAIKNISLESYHLTHAVRGALESELGRFEEAILHFRKAGALAVLPSERDFIRRRIEGIEGRISEGPQA